MSPRRCSLPLALPLAVWAQGTETTSQFWNLRIGDVVTIFAVLLAPVVALQVQWRLQLNREKRDRKRYIFKTLMATRASRLSVEHVGALNMIDIEFYGECQKDKGVVRAWNVYRDHLNTPSVEEQHQRLWNEKGNELFTALLVKVAAAVDYDFDEVLLKKGAYFPRWQGELEDDQFLLRKGLIKLLGGNQPLKMDVVSFPATVSEDEAREQQRIRALLVEYLEGRRPMPIIMAESPTKQAG
jgi:hypothetical protein